MTRPNVITPHLASRFPKQAAILGACLATALAAQSLGATEPSIARIWNERALASIRADTPHPPAQARNLFSFSVCAYDAWAAYDPVAVGYVYRKKHTATAVATARREAISYAVWRMQKERHAYSRTARTTLDADDALLVSLGYSTANASRDPRTPAGVGNAIYDAVSLWFSNDGSRQTNGTPFPLTNPPIAYPDYNAGEGGYTFLNPPLATSESGISDGAGHTLVDVNIWQRLFVVNAVDQSGFPIGSLQPYLGAQWFGVRPVNLRRHDPAKPWIDPGPPPFFGSAHHAAFRDNVVAVIRASSELTPDDGVVLDISPASQGNNSLGANDGRGRPINPVTGNPYPTNLAKRGDFTRALAEFWADGPVSETPPGHWNLVAHQVTDHPLTSKRIGGLGPVVDDLEWDVKLLFALNAATHDAACAAWTLKRFYNAWRPLSAVRYMGSLGQSSDPSLPSFHTNGLPLIPNLIELVTHASINSGRHAGLTAGRIALLAWPGEPPHRTSHQGVKWIHAANWTTYQRSNFVTPAFPGYVSGHSTFSRSAAEVLTAFTGSAFFPDGLGQYTVTNLLHEKGPTAPVTLQWATYFDAADQAGLSRIWGGIHPRVDDFAGRRVGAECGRGVWALVQRYWDGSVANTPLHIARNGTGQCEVSYDTLRGFRYTLQSATALAGPYFDVAPDGSQPFEASSILRTDSFSEPLKFYRLITSDP